MRDNFFWVRKLRGSRAGFSTETGWPQSPWSPLQVSTASRVALPHRALPTTYLQLEQEVGWGWGREIQGKEAAHNHAAWSICVIGPVSLKGDFVVPHDPENEEHDGCQRSQICLLLKQELGCQEKALEGWVFSFAVAEGSFLISSSFRAIEREEWSYKKTCFQGLSLRHFFVCWLSCWVFNSRLRGIWGLVPELWGRPPAPTWLPMLWMTLSHTLQVGRLRSGFDRILNKEESRLPTWGVWTGPSVRVVGHTQGDFS